MILNFIDYRKALGLSFDDKDKKELFIKRIGVFMQSGENCPFEEQDEIDFSYMIGEEYLLANIDIFEIKLGNDPIGLQRAWLYLSKRTESFEDFLSCVVALINTYGGNKTNKKTILSGVKKALSDSRIEFELIEDNDGIFIFPKGAKELDSALVSQPLEWLSKYPNSRKTYCIALKQYSEGIYIRDVADNLRKAFEEFLREFLVNDNDLNKNKKEVEIYLKKQNADPQLITMLVSLISHYYLLNNEVAKHNDKMDKKYLEYLLYQTGIFMRMLIVVKTEESNNAD